MRIGRWGNSPAVHLPAVVVEGLGLQEGDEIKIEIVGKRRFRIDRGRTRETALAHLRALNWTLPPGFRLSRDEANDC